MASNQSKSPSLFQDVTTNKKGIVAMNKAIESKVKEVTDFLVKSTEKYEKAEKWLTNIKGHVADAACQEAIRKLKVNGAAASAARDAALSEKARLAAELSALKTAEEHEGAKEEHEGAKAERKGAEGAQVCATEQADIATKQAGVAAHAVIMADKAHADRAVDAECRELRITLGKVNAAQCEEGDLQAKLLVVANTLARRAERAARQLDALKKLPNGAAAIKTVKAIYKTAAPPVFDKKPGSFFSPN
jgi:hypothetical protein